MTKKQIELLNGLGIRSKDYNNLYDVYSNAPKTIRDSMRLGYLLAKSENRLFVSEPEIIDSAEKARQALSEEFDFIEKVEEIHCLLLDNKHRVIGKYKISKGGRPNGAELDLRLFFKQILKVNATAVIIAHNHPSGDTLPSIEDRRMSKKLDDILKSINVDLLDHLILTENSFGLVHW